MKRPNFIPKDHKLCSNCIFYEQCPYDYTCKTWWRLRNYEAGNIVCNGNSTEKVR